MRIRRRGIAYILFTLVLLTAVACQSDRSSLIIDDDDMEDLLYDIHRAHFLEKDGHELREDGSMQYAVFLNVLKKHGVTQAQWDSSMVYYCCHADELKDIYNNLGKRLENEAEAVGAAVTSSNDSTNIWNADKSIILTSYQPNTTRQWELQTDSLVKPGETLTLHFIGYFLQPQDDMRAQCVLAIRLANDSIISTSQMMSRTGIYNVRLQDVGKVGIKEVKGMFMMHRGNINNYAIDNRTETTSQVLSITEIALLHEMVATPETNSNLPINNPISPNDKAPILDRVPKRLELQNP